MKKLVFWSLLVASTTLALLPTNYLPPQAFSLWDKAQHALGFTSLTLVCLWAYPQHARLVPFVLLLHGGLIELVQWWSGWRHGEWTDLLADAIGIALAVVLSKSLPLLRRPSA